MEFKMKGSEFYGNGKSPLKQKRETSWWKAEEGWIPDELQGVKRKKVHDDEWHQKRTRELDAKKLKKQAKIKKKYGSLKNEPAPKGYKRQESGALYDAKFPNPDNLKSR